MELNYVCPDCGHEWITNVPDHVRISEYENSSITCGCGRDILIKRLTGGHVGGVTASYVKAECKHIAYAGYIEIPY